MKKEKTIENITQESNITEDSVNDTVKNYISIAIDGPSGAGKSTLSRRAAEHFGFIHVDTGAIYRTLGLYALRGRVSPEDTERVTRLLSDVTIDLVYDSDGNQKMLLCGEDVTGEIRTPEVSEYASRISAIPAVRRFLLEMQRELAGRYNVIMDGRDIGTVVLRDADLKIFLTANPEDRAMRRLNEFMEKGLSISYEQVLESIVQRDENDSRRSESPLRAAHDAVVLDTTGNSLDESAELIIETISDRLGDRLGDRRDESLSDRHDERQGL